MSDDMLKLDGMLMIGTRISYYEIDDCWRFVFKKWNANAWYSPHWLWGAGHLTGGMFIDENVRETTLFHEFIHAYQDLLRGAADDHRNEGEAWAAELQYGALWHLANLEKGISEKEAALVRRSWRGLWMALNGTGTGAGIVGFPSGVGPVKAAHVAEIKRLTGFAIRCDSLAELYTPLLQKAGLDQPPLCMRLLCEPAKIESDVGTIAPLDYVWRY